MGGGRAVRDAERLLRMFRSTSFETEAAAWALQAEGRAVAALKAQGVELGPEQRPNTDAHGIIGTELLERMNRFGIGCSRYLVLS